VSGSLPFKYSTGNRKSAAARAEQNQIPRREILRYFRYLLDIIMQVNSLRLNITGINGGNDCFAGRKSNDRSVFKQRLGAD